MTVIPDPRMPAAARPGAYPMTRKPAAPAAPPPRRGRAGDTPEAANAGGPRRGSAGRRVLDHDAFRRGRAEAGRGMQVDVRRRFGTRHHRRHVHVLPEEPVEPRDLEREA